jgi:uncharacterized protein YjbI with pentapeptide repeats
MCESVAFVLGFGLHAGHARFMAEGTRGLVCVCAADASGSYSGRMAEHESQVIADLDYPLSYRARERYGFSRLSITVFTTVVVVLLLLALLLLALVLLDQLHVATQLTTVGALLVPAGQLVLTTGALLAIAYFARQAAAAGRAASRGNRETETTRRFIAAMECLRHPRMEVRLAGVYGLARIARTSVSIQSPVVDVLTAFVRTRSSLLHNELDLAGHPFPRADLQAAMIVLCNEPWVNPRHGVLDLSNADLRDLNLRAMHLEGALLRGADLTRSTLINAHLEGANLENAHLESATLLGAHLERAFLAGADLHRAVLTGAHLRDCNLVGANLEGAVLLGADVAGADLYAAVLAGALFDEEAIQRTAHTDLAYVLPRQTILKEASGN